MNRFIIALCLLLSVSVATMPVRADIPYQTATGTFNAATSASGAYNAFDWVWFGTDDVRINCSLSPAGMSNIAFRLCRERRGSVYLDVLDGAYAVTNYTASISRTNLPPSGVYYAEFLGATVPITSGITRVFATGKVNIQQSLWASTNSASWTNTSDGQWYLLPVPYGSSLTTNSPDGTTILWNVSTEKLSVGGSVLTTNSAAWLNVSTQSAGAVQADLADHKTNATAHSALLAGYYPASNPSNYGAGTTYTFAPTNAPLNVYTGGTHVAIGTNAPSQTNNFTGIVYSNPAAFYPANNPSGYISSATADDLAWTNYPAAIGASNAAAKSYADTLTNAPIVINSETQTIGAANFTITAGAGMSTQTVYDLSGAVVAQSNLQDSAGVTQIVNGINAWTNGAEFGPHIGWVTNSGKLYGWTNAVDTNYVVVSGTLSPDVTGVYTNIGERNGHPEYASGDRRIMYRPVGFWFISEIDSDSAATNWVNNGSQNVTGLYNNNPGFSTGNATVDYYNPTNTIHGTALTPASVPASAINPADWAAATNQTTLADLGGITNTPAGIIGAGGATGTPIYVEAQTLAGLGGMTNTAAGIAAAGGLTNLPNQAWLESATLPIVNGTATVDQAACWLAPGAGTNVVLVVSNFSASAQVAFGVAVSNIGYGTGYTNSLNLPTATVWQAMATNVVCTNPATVYWLIGGRGAQQTKYEIRP